MAFIGGEQSLNNLGVFYNKETNKFQIILSVNYGHYTVKNGQWQKVNIKDDIIPIYLKDQNYKPRGYGYLETPEEEYVLNVLNEAFNILLCRWAKKIEDKILTNTTKNYFLQSRHRDCNTKNIIFKLRNYTPKYDFCDKTKKKLKDNNINIKIEDLMDFSIGFMKEYIKNEINTNIEVNSRKNCTFDIYKNELIKKIAKSQGKITEKNIMNNLTYGELTTETKNEIGNLYTIIRQTKEQLDILSNPKKLRKMLMYENFIPCEFEHGVLVANKVILPWLISETFTSYEKNLPKHKIYKDQKTLSSFLK